MTDVLLTAEQEAATLAGLLSEYTGRLRDLNDRVLEHWADKDSSGVFERHAVLLDRMELIRKPLERVIGWASQLLEHGDLEPVQSAELGLRLTDVETELHHSIRFVERLNSNLYRDQQFVANVARLRVAAGLNAMKGGPLRPNA